MRSGCVDQPSDAVNQLLHWKGLDQAHHAGLIQEGADFGIIAKAGDEDEATPEFRAHLSGLVVEIVPPHDIRVVLLDYSMPQLNGAETLRLPLMISVNWKYTINRPAMMRIFRQGANR